MSTRPFNYAEFWRSRNRDKLTPPRQRSPEELAEEFLEEPELAVDIHVREHIERSLRPHPQPSRPVTRDSRTRRGSQPRYEERPPDIGDAARRAAIIVALRGGRN